MVATMCIRNNVCVCVCACVRACVCACVRVCAKKAALLLENCHEIAWLLNIYSLKDTSKSSLICLSG